MWQETKIVNSLTAPIRKRLSVPCHVFTNLWKFIKYSNMINFSRGLKRWKIIPVKLCRSFLKLAWTSLSPICFHYKTKAFSGTEIKWTQVCCDYIINIFKWWAHTHNSSLQWLDLLYMMEYDGILIKYYCCYGKIIFHIAHTIPVTFPSPQISSSFPMNYNRFNLID